MKVTLWIARDKSNVLYLYDEKPYKDKERGVWRSSNNKHCYISNINTDEFKSIQWSDEEPRELILKPLEESQWIARDTDGWVTIFEEKPIRDKEIGCWNPIPGSRHEELCYVDFPQVKWEDEPKLLIVIEE